MLARGSNKDSFILSLLAHLRRVCEDDGAGGGGSLRLHTRPHAVTQPFCASSVREPRRCRLPPRRPTAGRGARWRRASASARVPPTVCLRPPNISPMTSISHLQTGDFGLHSARCLWLRHRRQASRDGGGSARARARTTQARHTPRRARARERAAACQPTTVPPGSPRRRKRGARPSAHRARRDAGPRAAQARPSRDAAARLPGRQAAGPPGR